MKSAVRCKWCLGCCNPNVFRVEADHLAEVGDGEVEIALHIICETAAEVSIGIFGVEPDRFAKVGDGALVISVVKVSVASEDDGPLRGRWPVLLDSG